MAIARTGGRAEGTMAAALALADSTNCVSRRGSACRGRLCGWVGASAVVGQRCNFVAGRVDEA